MKISGQAALLDAPAINSVRQDGSEAFSDLVRMHSQQVYSISLRMLNNHADAEDNLQDVFCKAYLNLHGFKGRSCLSTWLVRIAINEALMKIRKQRSKLAAIPAIAPSTESEENAVREIEDRKPNPEFQCITNELVAKAFHGLHPRLRQTFLLHKGEGWTQREVAGSLGIATGTVKARIFRARMRMQQRLRPVS